jgi:hypothetical protein
MPQGLNSGSFYSKRTLTDHSHYTNIYVFHYWQSQIYCFIADAICKHLQLRVLRSIHHFSTILFIIHSIEARQNKNITHVCYR